jgi:hypothetical protein
VYGLMDENGNEVLLIKYSSLSSINSITFISFPHFLVCCLFRYIDNIITIILCQYLFIKNPRS